MAEAQNGIDISKWQNPSAIDYAKLTADQDFVICRAAYGSRSDKHFRTHFANLRKEQSGRTDLCLGAYLFLRQTQDWRAQLEAFIGELDAVGFGEGDIFPFVDLEWNTKYDGKIDPRRFNPIAQNVLEELRGRYGGALPYLSPGFFQTMKEPPFLFEYDWWVAHYTSEPEPGLLPRWKEKLPRKTWSIWQYTGTGRHDGYEGDLDLNTATYVPLIGAPVEDLDDDEIPNLANQPGAWDGDGDGVVEAVEIAEVLEEAARRVRGL